MLSFQEVNQKDSSLEHDLSACRKVLELPVKHFLASETASIWKLWRDLLKQVRTLFLFRTSKKTG